MAGETEGKQASLGPLPFSSHDLLPVGQSSGVGESRTVNVGEPVPQSTNKRRRRRQDDASIARRLRTPVSWGHIAIGVALLWTTFTLAASNSVIFPIYAKELDSQGYSFWFMAILFSLFSFSMVLSIPIAGAIAERLARPFMAAIGIGILSISLVIFGYAIPISNGERWLLTTIYVTSRIVSGFGAALTELGMVSVAADAFQGHLGKLIGANEVMDGLGFISGPAIGIALSSVLGEGPTMLVFGSMILASLPLAIAAGAKRQELETNSHHRQSFLSRWGQVLTCGVFGALVPSFLSVFTVASLIALMPGHLRDLGVPDSQIGVAIAVQAVAFILAGFPLGWLTDTWDPSLVSILGQLALGVLFCLVGLPLTNLMASAFNQSDELVAIYRDCTFLALTGTAEAAVMVAMLPTLQQAMQLEASSSASEALVAIWSSTNALALATGPLLGMMMDEYYGFQRTMLILGILLLFASISRSMWVCLKRRSRKGSAELSGVRVGEGPTPAKSKTWEGRGASTGHRGKALRAHRPGKQIEIRGKLYTTQETRSKDEMPVVPAVKMC